jgi:tetratricopeptide (TPR) repeat protein
MGKDRIVGCRAAIAVAMAAAVGLMAMPAAAQTPAEEPAAACQDESAGPEARVAACTRVIEETARPAPERVEALITRAAIHDDAGRLDAALADLDEALKLAPKDATALLLRGNVHYARGDLAKALADYDAGIAAEPSDPAGYFNRAIVYEAQDERDKAIADFKKALELDPAFAEAKAALEELGVK